MGSQQRRLRREKNIFDGQENRPPIMVKSKRQAKRMKKADPLHRDWKIGEKLFLGYHWKKGELDIS